MSATPPTSAAPPSKVSVTSRRIRPNKLLRPRQRVFLEEPRFDVHATRERRRQPSPQRELPGGSDARFVEAAAARRARTRALCHRRRGRLRDGWRSRRQTPATSAKAGG